MFQSGVSRQYLVALISTISAFNGGIVQGWPNPVIPTWLSPEWEDTITTTDISWIVSITQFSAIVGALPSAYFMDKFGRKNSLLFLTILAIISWILVLYVTSAFWLCVMRFLIGMFLGVSYTIVPVYIAEISEPQIRGSLGNFMSLMTTSAIVCGAVPLIFVCTFAFMPESPYYYLMIKDNESAKKSLMWLRNGSEETIQAELTRISKAIAQEMENTGGLKELLATKGNRKALLIAVMLCFIQKFSGMTALNAYTSITLPKEALPSIGVNGCVMILGAIAVVACCGLTMVFDRFAKKTLLITSCVGCGSMMLVLAVWYYLYEQTSVDVSSVDYIPFVCFCIHTISYSIALGPVALNVAGELFPSNVKSSASVISLISQAATSFVVTKMYLLFLDYGGFYIDFIIFGVVTLLGAVFTLTVVIETRGKSLQEIQEELNGVNGKRVNVIA